MGRREAEEAVHPASEPFLDVLGVEFAQEEVLGDGKGDDCIERPCEQVDAAISWQRSGFARPLLDYHRDWLRTARKGKW